MADLEVAIEKFVTTKRALKVLEEEAEAAQAALLEVLTALQIKTVSDEEHNCTLTVTNGSRKKYVPEKLKAVLPAWLWKKVRVDAVDPKVIEGFLATGQLTVQDMGDGCEVTMNKPYIRLTEGKPAVRKAS